MKLNSRKVPPDDVKSVLLIDPLFCFGDALFVNGLVKFLKAQGIVVGLITFPRLNGVYTSLNKSSIYNIEDPINYKPALLQHWDMVVDLCYMFNQRWEYRKAIVAELKTYTVICDRSIGTSPYKDIYSEYLDVSDCCHFGDRMGRIAERITGRDVGTILPYAGIATSQNVSVGKYVYVNTVGGTSPRCLNQEQINLIAGEFNNKEIHGLFYCSDEICLEESKYVKKVHPQSFVDCLQIIAGAEAIISPDTSVVHAASAYDKPLLAFYCENDPEHYGMTMRDIWAPLCSKQIVLTPYKKGVHRVPISSIDPEQLKLGLRDFFSMFLNS